VIQFEFKIYSLVCRCLWINSSSNWDVWTVHNSMVHLYPHI